MIFAVNGREEIDGWNPVMLLVRMLWNEKLDNPNTDDKKIFPRRIAPLLILFPVYLLFGQQNIFVYAGIVIANHSANSIIRPIINF